MRFFLALLFVIAAGCSDDDYGQDLGNNDIGVDAGSSSD
jgi:hypothetical protein